MEYNLVQINGYTGIGLSLIIMIIGLFMIINIQKDLENL